MIRFRSPITLRFNYCSRFTRFRYLFFIYKLFYNPFNLWTLFTTLVLRKYLWVRFVKRNYVYYLRCLNPLKRAFCLHKRFFYLLQSSIFPLFHVLFCIISTTFSFLLNRLLWLLFYLRSIKAHFFFIRNLSFPSIIFINNQTNKLLKKLTLFIWTDSYLFNYFFSKLYKVFNFRFFALRASDKTWSYNPNYLLFQLPHHRSIINVSSHTQYSKPLSNFLIFFYYYYLALLVEIYVFVCRLFTLAFYI